ncbi:MAG TPA: glycoside hydrolase family 88 protein [Anaerolineae bacterium]|nr:glycoside hydrolase family 88 protein [Anaerolineae bacterium]
MEPGASIERVLTASLARLGAVHRGFGDRFPTVGEGRCYRLAANDHWLAGFWTGLLWLGWAATGDDELRAHAESLLPGFRERLEGRVHLTHDLGFLFTLSARAQWQLTANEEARHLALLAARELARRYRPAGRYIQAWGELADAVEAGRAIIDTMMNLPLLFWAARETGDVEAHRAAREHAETSLRYLLRPDGASYHTFLFDPATGEPLGPRTHQGYADDSLWARGQAWTIYGFALAAEWCREPRFQDAARRAAERFLVELPPDGIVPWDLRLPEARVSGEPPYPDSSAMAIAAGGLLRLARLDGEPRSGEFRAAACTLLENLIAHCWESEPTGEGLLRHATVHARRGQGVDAYFICGDYYFLEALLAVQGQAPDFWGPGGSS